VCSILATGGTVRDLKEELIPYRRVIQYHIRYGHLRSEVPYVMPEFISPFIYDQIPGWMEMTKDRTYQYVQASVSTVTRFHSVWRTLRAVAKNHLFVPNLIASVNLHITYSPEQVAR
jgi:hypothetical protein